MNIGGFQLKKGRLMGWIATRMIDLPQLGLRPVESENERAPLFEIVALNVGNRWVQVGALWPAVSKKHGPFLQGNIDDPSLPEPVPIALFGNEEEGYRVAWRREQPRDAFAPAGRAQQQGGYGQPGDSGFESTAGEDGALAPVGDDLNDDMPF